MTNITLLLRSLCIALLAQLVLMSPAPAAESSGRHRLLLFHSANVFGQLEPCGG